MPQESRITAIRLPLQIGTSSLWSVARSSALFPGLVLVVLGVWTIVELIDMDKIGFAIGGTLVVIGGLLLYYAYKHIRLALDERPSDVVLDATGLRIEGGAQHGLMLAWSEIDTERCRVESTTDERLVLWRVIVNLPFFALAIVSEGGFDIGVDPTEKTPIKRLWVARRGEKEVLVAEGELPTEIESLDTLMHTIQSPHWYGKQKKAPSGPKAIVCTNCGAAIAPSSELEVPCAFCSTRVVMPEDVRQRVAAASQLAHAREAGFSRLTRLLESQPSAARAGVAILAAAIPIALAWPIAALFIVRAWHLSGADGARFIQLGTFPLLLTFGAFLLARGRLTDRFALHAVVVGFGARDPARPGEPYRCRACEAPLPPQTGTPIARCVYCKQASVIGLDLRAEARSAKNEERSLEDALAKRARERWLWTGGSVLSLALLALAVFALRGTFAMPHLAKNTSKTASAHAASPRPPIFPSIAQGISPTRTEDGMRYHGACTLYAEPADVDCRASIRCGNEQVYSTSRITCVAADHPLLLQGSALNVDFTAKKATLKKLTYSVEFRFVP